jgi:hypothetical protein
MPAYIREFTVLDPQTSKGVEDLAAPLLERDSSGILSLVGVELQDVPRSEQQELKIRVHNMLRSSDGGRLIRGLLMDGDTERTDQVVTIITEADPVNSATLTLVGIHHE